MWKRLERWQQNIEAGMTKDKYMSMCVQMCTEPREDKCPPDIDDLPFVLQQAIIVFNRLGDRVFPDIGYLGKDYTALPIHMKVVGVVEEELFLEALVRLDSYLIEKSAKQMKAARDALKRK